MRQAKRTIRLDRSVPAVHVCPAAPDGKYTPVTIADLRVAGLNDEAEQVEREARRLGMWHMESVSGSAMVLTTFGCCKQAELATAILAGRAAARKGLAGAGSANATARKGVE